MSASPVSASPLPDPLLAEAGTPTAQTRRNTAPALEEILFAPQPVLDHGFIRVIDYMGDDAAIVQAARVSYGRGTRKVQEDEGLIRYLMRHAHTTPFEMCSLKLHIKLPIFVARQWIRHRTASVNEISGRYSLLDNEFYVPPPEQAAIQASENRQGRGRTLSEAESAYVLNLIHNESVRAYRTYLDLLNQDEEGQPLRAGQDGLARELARMNLTLNFYTQWYWKINLHNLFHFLQLRVDPHAQYEIRVYAQAIFAIVQRWVPLAAAAFQEYRLGGAQLSATALHVIRRRLAGETVTAETSGLSPREWRELQALLEPPA